MINFNQIKFSFYLVFLANLGEFLFPEYRQIFWGFNLLSLILIPYKYLFFINKRNFPSFFCIVYILFLLLNIGYIIESILYPHGQSIITILGNPAFIFFHTVSLFLLMAVDNRILHVLYKVLTKSLIIGSFLVIAFERYNIFARSTINYFVVVCTYFSKKYKIFLYFLIVVILGLYISIKIGSRLDFLGILLVIVVCIFYKYFVILRRIAIVFCTLCVLFPMIFIYIGIKTGYSIFEVTQSIEILADEETGVSLDTRTFVYYEVLGDLEKNDKLLFGKGISSRIETSLNPEVDLTVNKEGRAFVEVGFLDNMRRGGLIYSILFYFFQIVSAFYALFNSKNRFLLITAMAIAFFFFQSFIGHVLIFNLEYVLLWVLIGLSISKKWNKFDDKDIKRLFFKG